MTRSCFDQSPIEPTSCCQRQLPADQQLTLTLTFPSKQNITHNSMAYPHYLYLPALWTNYLYDKVYTSLFGCEPPTSNAINNTKTLIDTNVTSSGLILVHFLSLRLGESVTVPTITNSCTYTCFPNQSSAPVNFQMVKDKSITWLTD